AYEHQDVPFEKVVETLVRERDMSRSPLFDVLFVLQNQAGPGLSKGSLPDLELLREEVASHTSRFDLTYTLTETAEGWEGSIEYCTDLYRKETICRMIGHYKELLNAVILHAGQAIGSLPMLPLAEQEQLVRGFNGREVSYPKDQTLLDLFGSQVLRCPSALAVWFGDEELSYRELDERSNQVARYLQG
ncbi:condensation domain-containing protein, partial [Flavitalea flava]